MLVYTPPVMIGVGYVRRKGAITLIDCMKFNEMQMRQKANQILLAKKAGVHQKAINTMVKEFELFKIHYDALKKRADEGNGK